MAVENREPMGIRHLTVVPENFRGRRDDPEDDDAPDPADE